VPIQDVRAGDLVYSWAAGRCVTCQVTAAWKPKHQPVFEVRTRNRAVTAPANYSFPRLVQTSKSRPTAGRKRLPSQYRPEWARLDQLRRGDLLIEPRSLAAVPAARPPVLASGTAVDMDVAWLIGAITGDGTVVAKGLNLALYGADRGRASEIITSRWSSHPGHSAKHGLFVSCIRLRDDLTALGMRRAGPDKRMPGAVWAWPPKLQEAYLEGYCDADGHRPADQARHGVRTYHSASRELIEDVRALHISLGGPVSNISTIRRTKPIVIKGKLVRNARDQHEFTVWRSGSRKGTWWASANQGIQAWVAGHEDFTVTRLLGVTPAGEQDTWDLDTAAHSFIADGLVVHTSEPAG
jgi:hypothetical protein